MAFHFLNKALHGDEHAGGGVFGFLANAGKAGTATVTGNKQAQQNAVQGLQSSGLIQADKKIIGQGVDLVQGTARTPETLLRSGAQAGYDLANKISGHQAPDKNFSGHSPFGFLDNLYGDVQTYQQRTEGNKKVIEGSRFRGAAKPLSVLGAGLTIGSDVTGFGGKKGADEIAKDLAKASTAKDAHKALVQSGVEDSLAHKIAPAVAHTKDPNIINNIIDNAHKPPAVPPSPIQDIRPPTPGGVAEAGGQSNEARNRFLDTIKNAPSTSPEFKDAISGLKETHPQRDTMALSDAAKKTVEEKPDEVLARILTSPSPKDTDVAEGIHLMRTLQQDAAKLKASGDEAGASAKLDTANKLAEDMTAKATAGGRYSQAHSIMNRMSPEGIYYNAVKKVQNVREANPKNVAKEKKLAGELQGQLEKPVGKEEVSKTVKQLANEDLSTGEKLAKNVETAATPKVKKPTDALVQELTKKVKQEYLAPVSQIKRSPLDVLKETFGRADEAHHAYPEAQQILREKFANDPKMSEALDKFFGSKLDLPAANSTINKAIQNQLKTNGDRVSEVIHKSLIEQGQSVEKVAQELTKEGFDEQSAKTLAQEVHKRLGSQFSEAKKAKLEQMMKDTPERGRSTYIDKLNKLSNLGALDKEDYLHLARAKLNLPHLTPEASAKISELSQKLQGLPEGHEKASTIREIANTVHGSIPLTKGQYIKNIPGLMRTIVASGDFSFGGRQGLAYATAHPISFAKAWPKQFEYFGQAFKGGDSEAFDAMMADIKNHPDYGYLEKSGLAILDPHAHLFNQREEQFIGTEIADKIPGVKNLVDASAYAYTGLANYIRSNEFYGQLEHLKAAGVEISDKTVKDLANTINNGTGRGDLGRFEKAGNVLMTGLFAPRLIASRVNMMDPRYYANLEPAARKEAVRQLLGLSAFGVGVLGMAKMAGADVSTDPRSADFGKAKVGDTRFDVLGGFTQYIRFGAQFITGQKVDSTTGGQTEAGKGLAGSRLDILLNFFENKEAPFPSLVTTELKGKDISGNSIYNVKGQRDQLAQRFIPLLAQDIADLFSHPNGASPLTGIAGGFGLGIQTYGQQDLPVTGKEKTYLEDLQTKGVDKEQINASRQFFQLLKTAPDKQKTTDQIHKAIDDQDYQKAQQLAQEYNQKLDSHIADSGWVDDNGQYITPYLEKQYNSSKINLTPQSVKAYLKSKEGV
jgi:hypothetical protein